MSEINAIVAQDYRQVIKIRDGDTREDLSPYFSSRSEEHTSELQSLVNLVCRLLLEKKNKKTKN